MEMVRCPAPILVKDSCLEDWTRIGSGGFGQIYKARHKKLCCEVAIKLLHYDDGDSSSLLRELDMMRQGSNPYVIQVLGVFRGLPPTSGSTVQLGLVMEFMERGSLATLQKRLCGAPPWPLVFSLAHQVALGINFLHNMSPPLLHLDLKPPNVLLDSYLKAKLTDFGLARVCRSVSCCVSKKDGETEAGTLSYLPPEAFDLSYRPTKAYDIYSFGILLWSIITGKQPYEYVQSSIIRLRVPQGDRPSLENIRVQAAGIAGLTGLVDLMKRCWDSRPSERPSSYNCTLVTEELFKMHKHAVNSAVLQVIQKLDQPQEERLLEQLQLVHISQPREPSPMVAQQCAQVHINTHTRSPSWHQVMIDHIVDVVKGCYTVPTGKGPVQEVARGSANWDQARVKDNSVPYSVRVSDTERCRSASDAKFKSSSVKPIGVSPPPSSPPSPSPSSNSRNRPPQHAFVHLKGPRYQRQFSSPDSVPRLQPQSPFSHVNINCSNVTGLQCGNNNIMNIEERKRHSTAPSRVDLPPQRMGSSKNKMGGVG